MQEQDFYTAINEHIYKAKEPFTVIFTKLSLERNEGGELRTLENQLQGPLKKNMNSRFMVGLKDMQTNKERHIYLHTILEIITFEGTHIKLNLN